MPGRGAGRGTVLILHDYWRSGAAYRVRIALSLKDVAYTRVGHDLRTGEQRDPAYQRIAPQGLVPAIESDGFSLTQSLAILEWLEECCPEPPLLPPSPEGRAIVRSMCGLIACDIHPLNNLRVLQFLEHELGQGAEAKQAWIARWISDGFAALEHLIAQHGQGFAFGSTPTLADCCLLPQVYSAIRYGVPLMDFPGIRAVTDAFQRLPAVQSAAPERQPDADRPHG